MCILWVVQQSFGFLNYKRYIVALSTIEAKHVTSNEESKEIIWLQSFLEEFGQKQEKSVLHCDCQSAIHLAMNLIFYARTKHI